MKSFKIYIFAGLVAALLLIEVVARLLGFGETVQVKLHDKIEYVLVENQDVTRFGNRISINSNGHRSEVINLVKPANEKRIMLLGDSVVYGNHHIDQTETIAHYLSNSLNDETSAPHTVISAAASSWGPKNMLEYIKERGLYESDLVYLVLSSHDIFDFPDFNRAVIPYRVNKNIAATDDIIYAVYNRAKPWLKSKFNSTGQGLSFEEASLRTRSIINEIIEYAQNQDVEIILVFHPSAQQSMNDFLDVSFFENIANRNNIDFLNMQPDYKNFNIFSLDKVHYDGLHLTAEGAELFAKIIKEKTLDKLNVQ